MRSNEVLAFLVLSKQCQLFAWGEKGQVFALAGKK
jgi:hypothetical protein